jgi:hypothetical protein
MTESQLTANLLKKLRFALPGADIHKVNERIAGGRPDCHIIQYGWHTDIEFKGPKTPITPLQRRTIDKMRRAGAVVLVVRFTGGGLNHVIEEGVSELGPTYDGNLIQFLLIDRTSMFR